MLGNLRIYALKFADDVALVADNPLELRGMFKELKRYAKKNKIEVNVKKTKVMICRNGGNKKKEKKWKYGGKIVEEVKEFKYLGYWYTIKNGVGKHVKEMAKKAQKATNAIWGVIKRSKRNRMRDRIYLMNTVAGAAALYGVEVWGWGEVKDIERVQGRFCKMVLGINRNTPGYIWRKETGVQNIKATTRERAARYVKDVLAMEDDRWPKIALREEMRGILNRNPTKWGRKLHTAIKEMGCEEIAGMIYNKEEKEKIDAGIERFKEKLKEEDEKAIERSSYNRIYKKIMIEKDGYNYWKDDKKRGEDKEQWAKIRCGNIGRAYKKGFTEWTCRLCEGSMETLTHLIKCKETKKGVNEEERKYLEKWDMLVEEEEIEREICTILKGKIDETFCEIFRKVEKLIKSKAEAEKIGEESAEAKQRIQ